MKVKTLQYLSLRSLSAVIGLSILTGNALANNPNGWQIVSPPNASYSYLFHGQDFRQYLNVSCTSRLRAENISIEQSSFSIINNRTGQFAASCDEVIAAFAGDVNNPPIDNPNGWQIVRTSPTATASYLLHGQNFRQYLNVDCTNRLAAQNISIVESSFSAIDNRTGQYAASCDEIIAAFTGDDSPANNPINNPVNNPVNNPPPRTGNDLFTSADWDRGYRGTFRLPDTLFVDGVKYYYKSRAGGTGLGLTPDGNLLVMAEQVGSAGSPLLTKVSTPTPSTNTINPPVASLLESVNLTGMLETDPDGNARSPLFKVNSTGKDIRVEDLIVDGNRIVASAIIGYDGYPFATHSHFVIDSLNLNAVNDNTVRGMFDVASGIVPADLPVQDSGSGAYLAGYMTEIPEEWRASLGGYTHLGGQGGGSIQKRSNAGPGAYLFNASEIGSRGDVVALAHYPLETPNLSAPLHWDGRVNALQPQIFEVSPDFNQSSRVRGVFFVPGTRTVLFLGLTAAVSTNANTTSYLYYGLSNQYPSQIDPYYTDHKGEHSLGGNYQYQIWAYDIADFQRVLAGNMHSTEIRPYEVFRFDFPNVDRERAGKRLIGGTAIDYNSGRLYITQQMQSETALVHVYDLR